MDLNQYQREALRTAVYPEDSRIFYPAFKLPGEAGEVSEKIGKLLRDKGGLQAVQNISDEDREAIAKEIGDVLWYCAALSHDLGFTLGHIGLKNLEKLAGRKAAGTINGSGDNR